MDPFFTFGALLTAEKPEEREEDVDGYFAGAIILIGIIVGVAAIALVAAVR
jgi:hypothetical protein